jgi:hypothetical protein
MSAYKKLIWIIGVLTITSFLLACWLYFGASFTGADFWTNVCLGVFGSALLTILSAISSYNYERRRTLEGFSSYTRYILDYLSKYQKNMSIEAKLKYFLNYHDIDKIAWDMEFGNIDFFLECKIMEIFFGDKFRSRKYIYDKIYRPICNFNNAVTNHVWHFRMYLDGSGKNEKVIQNFVTELEDYLIKVTEKDIPTEYDENCEPTAFCHCSYVESKIVREINSELAGRYYEILYGKRIANKEKQKGE